MLKEEKKGGRVEQLRYKNNHLGIFAGVTNQLLKMIGRGKHFYSEIK